MDKVLMQPYLSDPGTTGHGRIGSGISARANNDGELPESLESQ